MIWIRCILAALAILVSFQALPPSALAAGSTPIERGAAEKLSDTPRAAAQSAELKAAAAAGDTRQLVAKTRALLESSTFSAAEREKLLFDAALALRQVQPDDDARALAQALQQVPAVVMVWHGEGAHRVAIPRFAVAAAAASAQINWQRQAARAQAKQKLHFGPAAFPALFGAASALSSQQVAGIADALNAASDAELALWREPLLLGLNNNRQLDGLAAIAARHLSDGPLFEALLSRGSEAVALTSLDAIRTTMPAGDALRLLTVAGKRDALASAALLQIGTLARADGNALEHLFATLANPTHGGSAAAALAALDDAAVTSRLRALLANTDHDVIRRRALLALRLTNSTAARDALTQWQQTAARSVADGALKIEAAAWMQQ